jgi:hypothetical protein
VTEHGILPGLWPIQGDGVLARQGDLVLLIHPGGGSFTDRLLEVLADAARTGASGLEFTARVAAEFDSAAAAADRVDELGPAVVAFGPADGGTAVAVYGHGWAEVTTARGTQRLSAGEPHGRLRGVLPSTLIAVQAGVQDVAGPAETDPYLRLADGVVRAVALLYAPAEVAGGALDRARPAAVDHGFAPDAIGVPASSPSAPAPLAEPSPPPAIPVAESAPAPEPALDQSLQVASEPYRDQSEEPEPEYRATRIESAMSAHPASPPVPDRYAEAPPLPADPYAAQPPVPDPYGGSPDGAQQRGFVSVPFGAGPPDAMGEMAAPMVDGVYCQNGHFNDPDAPDCAVCGLSIGHAMRQKGHRPPLGVLVLGDGSVCQLDMDYVIGREPTLDTEVAEGRARPLRLMDASGVVSRMHARVELDGWHVFITDLNSANGTQVLVPGERNPVYLQPGVRTPLAAGTQIRLGGEYGLQYDSHRQQ